jgi:hypothetical protein
MISGWLFEGVCAAAADFRLSEAVKAGAGNCAAAALASPTLSPGSLADSLTKPPHMTVATLKLDKSNKKKPMMATVLMVRLE